MRDVRTQAHDVLLHWWAEMPSNDYPEIGDGEFTEDDYAECCAAADEILTTLEAAGMTITAADAAPVADTVTRVMDAVVQWLPIDPEGGGYFVPNSLVLGLRNAVRTALAESAPDGGS